MTIFKIRLAMTSYTTDASYHYIRCNRFKLIEQLVKKGSIVVHGSAPQRDEHSCHMKIVQKMMIKIYPPYMKEQQYSFLKEVSKHQGKVIKT